ncbi:hypothetical protein H310_11107 [Aphanomyces invadans]|uniref:Uncharacterized protein n=1 Tax=Aphanomyces invadans TaxID=157072 RepID=A0A024TPY6_9STRA|nr:hypothetical protein H310_11107 [Aphanomyces invadans]ETV95691.1 hypothetical protein H310_11107 [Aphanomyces invadans]|eukprot:XP_008875884.1 hypothetical protein H310_11107 [Aphanomyces invadans]
MAQFKRHLRDQWIAEDCVSTVDDDNDDNWMSPTAKVNCIR